MTIDGTTVDTRVWRRFIPGVVDIGIGVELAVDTSRTTLVVR